MTLTREHIIKTMQEGSSRPLSYEELAEAMGIEDYEQFSRLLGRMEKEGDVVVNRKHKYGLPEAMNLMRGMLQVHPKGYAFLIPDDSAHADVYIFGRDLNGAMHNDRVMIRLNHGNGSRRGITTEKPEGEVIRVIRRAHREVVGTYKKAKTTGQVVPDDPRLIYPISVKPVHKRKIADGEKVVVRLTAYPEKDKYPEGKIIECLGKTGDPGVDMISLIKKHGLRDGFAQDVMKQAESVPQSVTETELQGRRDLRDQLIVTIDGDDAKDLDDAVVVTRTESGFRLGVHIADVSHYVPEDTALDREALSRGTSVYLVDRVLPMLPHALSNGICSLNAGVDRCAMSVQIDLDGDGEVTGYEVFRSVILVKERMTYKNVNKILKERDPELMERYRHAVPMFEDMRELASILKKRRLRLGALDFEFPEAKVILDEAGNPVAIEKRMQDVAENLIEEFMIRANEVVAAHLYQKQVPTLYRVHEKPDEDGETNIRRIVGLFNHKLPGSHLDSKILQGLLYAVRGKPEERVVATMILRSMKHARYTPAPLGHFGLASSYYVHFTSPIRRYPDLIVHRALGCLLDKGHMNAKTKAAWEKRMPIIGEQCTMCEMKAEEAERESVKMKMAQFMKAHEGECFKAVISGITAFGFFVELDNLVEGLVHISSLQDDYYLYDDRQLILVGRSTGKIYRFGDTVEVQLVKVNVEEAKIDFELAAK